MQDITLYMWATPNSRRASILLEELGLTFEVQPVNIRAGEQHDPKIVALSPFAKLPILTWHEEGERRVLFESGAIVISIAERVGQLLPSERDDRETTMSWLMVALTSVGPLTGMVHHWSKLAAEKSDVALKHHVSLVDRVYPNIKDTNIWPFSRLYVAHPRTICSKERCEQGRLSPIQQSCWYSVVLRQRNRTSITQRGKMFRKL